MIELKSIKGLFFLLFFTELSISKVYAYLEKYNNLDELINNENYNEDIIYSLLEKSNLSLEKTIFNNIKIIPFYDKNYPIKLSVLKDKPPLLFVKGKYKPEKKLINVVGTRENSEYGSKLTTKIVKLLTNNNFGITSGLALGIDTFAHKAALENDSYTISILATPLNTIYPKENYILANEIIKSGGALISEIPIDLNLGKRNFVQRNRIQAALSEITIPVELTKKSGTMHTVKFTVEQNKNVIFIKPIDNEEYIGNFNDVINYLKSKRNKLYSENIKIVSNSQELLDIVNKNASYYLNNQIQQLINF